MEITVLTSIARAGSIERQAHAIRGPTETPNRPFRPVVPNTPCSPARGHKKRTRDFYRSRCSLAIRRYTAALSLGVHQMSNEFAIVIPVAPGNDEIVRLARVLRSIYQHEPTVSWIVLVDDDASERHLQNIVRAPENCQVIELKNPRFGLGRGYLGGLFVGIMHGLMWVAKNTSAMFALKMDTDSLAIAPFSAKLCQVLNDHAAIGQVGVIGHTCDRERETFGCEARLISPLIRMHDLWERIKKSCTNDMGRIKELAATTRGLAWCAEFDQLDCYVRNAVTNGYHSLTFCHGGAYAVSAEMLERLLARHCFESYLGWAEAPIGEDIILSMYTYSMGLRLLDLSEKNQPFGIHWRGLPFEPARMIDCGYSIIHSLKNDSRYTELELASFFEQIIG
jgi:hypothetical protein